jgi:hypothetical protein
MSTPTGAPAFVVGEQIAAIGLAARVIDVVPISEVAA